MSGQTEKERELAELLVRALDMEEVRAEEIVPEAPLFGRDQPESLGLDSIDALEIALAIAQRYGVHLKADDENNRFVFGSLRSLSNYIQSQCHP